MIKKKSKAQKKRERRKRLAQAKAKAGFLDRRSNAQKAADALKAAHWERAERPSWDIKPNTDWRLKKKKKG